MLNLRVLIKSGKEIVPLPRHLPSTASRSGGGSGDDWHSPLTGFETLSGVGFRRILNTQMPARIGPVKDFGVMLKGNPSCW